MLLWNGSLKALRILSLINSLRLKNVPIAALSLNCIFLNSLTNWPAIGIVLANSANLVVERLTTFLKSEERVAFSLRGKSFLSCVLSALSSAVRDSPFSTAFLSTLFNTLFKLFCSVINSFCLLISLSAC